MKNSIKNTHKQFERDMVKFVGACIIIFIGLLALMNEAGAQTVTEQKTVLTCKGVKADKSPCKSVILLKNGYCNAHNPDGVKCSGMTAKKEPCKMVVKAKGEFCRFHQTSKN